eukprot:scaffold544_cov117-Isochrysis_galbana.AAC.12
MSACTPHCSAEKPSIASPSDATAEELRGSSHTRTSTSANGCSTRLKALPSQSPSRPAAPLTAMGPATWSCTSTTSGASADSRLRTEKEPTAMR